ncbi:IS200/IS605 family transposase [Longimicrobium sp.]|uniref:IS200/IS605 family transposase n=1 Tax=Longimicrobium sp. TaxID=2029185 RepID=UPI002C63B772|nr:IS200/IS605 family transposase [Longimicrobium sp.]HSU13759.1 IS200/IS605 family transposase [Longimicrobium sp.]
MSDAWTQLYLHLVWTTWKRAPLLVEPLRSEVYHLIQADCTRLRADVLAIGGIEDHVHLLVRVPPTLAPAMLVKQVKGSSAHAMNHAHGFYRTFRWQSGYGAFSVSKRHVPIITEYILNQEEHHREQRLWPLLEPPPAQPAEAKRPA